MGAACSMAAGALAEVLGVENAAEIWMEPATVALGSMQGIWTSPPTGSQVGPGCEHLGARSADALVRRREERGEDPFRSG